MIEKTSHLNWTPIYSQQRKEMVNEVQIGEVSTQDSQFFHVWELTQETQEVFDVVSTKERPYEYFDRVHLVINYEMNRNLMLYEREVYTSLDWFGNLGGLSEGLKLLFGLLVGLFNYNYYNNYMVAKLFTYNKTPGKFGKSA